MTVLSKYFSTGNATKHSAENVVLCGSILNIHDETSIKRINDDTLIKKTNDHFCNSEIFPDVLMVRLRLNLYAKFLKL